MKQTYTYGALALSLSLVVACAKPPTAQLADAETAVSAAQMAGADQYAAQDFAVAQEALMNAQAKMEEKDYKGALTAAVDAKAKAEIAQGAVEAGREQAKTQAINLMGEVENTLKTVKESAVKLKGDVAAEVKAETTAIEAEWTKVIEENANGNLMNVNDASTEILGRLQTLSAKVEEALKKVSSKKGK